MKVKILSVRYGKGEKEKIRADGWVFFISFFSSPAPAYLPAYSVLCCYCIYACISRTLLPCHFWRTRAK